MYSAADSPTKNIGAEWLIHTLAAATMPIEIIMPVNVDRGEDLNLLLSALKVGQRVSTVRVTTVLRRESNWKLGMEAFCIVIATANVGTASLARAKGRNDSRIVR